MEDARTRAIGRNARGFDSFRFDSRRVARTTRAPRGGGCCLSTAEGRKRTVEKGPGRARAIDGEEEGRATDERVVCRAKRRENVEHGAEQVQRARGGED